MSTRRHLEGVLDVDQKTFGRCSGCRPEDIWKVFWMSTRRHLEGVLDVNQKTFGRCSGCQPEDISHITNEGHGWKKKSHGLPSKLERQPDRRAWL